MGCCHARDKQSPNGDDKDGDYVKASRSSLFASQELLPFSSKFAELEAYSLHLSASSPSWTIDCSDDTYLIKHLPVPVTQASTFSSSSRCSYYSISFHRTIPHQCLIDVMEKESIRKSWDRKIREIKITVEEDGTRVVTSKFAMLLFNRTLVEARVTKEVGGETRVVYYSPGTIDENDTGKAFTFFGLHRYVTHEGNTTMMLFSQTDFRMPEIVKKAVAQIKGESEKWLKACHAQILEIVP